MGCSLVRQIRVLVQANEKWHSVEKYTRDFKVLDSRISQMVFVWHRNGEEMNNNRVAEHKTHLQSNEDVHEAKSVVGRALNVNVTLALNQLTDTRSDFLSNFIPTPRRQTWPG